MKRAFLRRAGILVGLTAFVLAASTGAKPFANGITYRVRVSSRLPALMGGAAGDAGPLVLARASAVGSRARFDLLTFQPMPPGVSLDDYLLVLDSARTVFVNTEQKSYVDAGRLLGGGGLGMIGTFAAGRRGGGNATGAPQLDITGLVTDFENVGKDTTDGKQTQHYRIVAEMTLGTMGRQMPLRIVIETWTANLAYNIINPFDLTARTSPDDPAAKLTAKLAEFRRRIDGTPIKTVVTTTLTLDAGGGPMMLDFTQTSTVTDIKEADVDTKQLEIPSGFARKTGG